MDPLSVAASVVGLIAAAAQMSATLYKMGSTIKDAPHLAQVAASELTDITVVLRQLQNYIEGRAQASIQRLSLITVEHITATLTGCVMTYSELDVVLKSLHIDTGLRTWDKAMWLLKKDEVAAIITRLQNHKSTLGLMLNIIQCASLSEAEISMDRLCDTVNKVLQSNEKLSIRLRNIENVVVPPTAAALRAGSMASSGQASAGAHSPSRSVRSQSIHSDDASEQQDASANSKSNQPKVSAFEEMLHRSRVYRHAEGRHSDSSLVDDGRSTLAFSICSSMTLGEVSKISVYALPVYATEISNPDCYSFGRLPEEAEGLRSQSSGTSQTADSNEGRKLSSPRTPWWKRLQRSPQTSKPDASSTSPGPPVFGVPLSESIRYANVAIFVEDENGEQYTYGYNPIVVAKCGVFLKEKATETKHIFETPGSPKNIQECQTRFDSPPRYGKGLDWTDYTVFDAASTLLRYLLLLPEPVIPFDFYERFVQPLREETRVDAGIKIGIDSGRLLDERKSKITQEYRKLFKDLPNLNQHLLGYLLDLIDVFADKSEINLVSVRKLAPLFQQGVLRSRDTTIASKDVVISQDVVVFLVEYQDGIIF